MKLYRSTRDRKIFGLCGGLAEYMGVDATLLRIVAIVLAVVSSGGFILIYILAALVVPKEPTWYNGPYGYGGPGSGGFGGYHHSPGGGGYWNPPHGSWRNPGYGSHGSHGHEYGQGAQYQTPPPNPGDLDAMMDDLEKKALRKEIEELKARIRELESKKSDYGKGE
ncbi:MAG: hypothetical protein A9Z00_10210 [Thermobacillus sp. ZCTH02-B1]|uniref:PspC domain-containing protein n=1 Tax=Thermobacillus sp. ZCTH02-B1 TaxID=1858795 RepID=UPI000B585186|nr:PspC domain-containing protein [Thermobacillus sp. ZCTH02-B1]OUM94553.1 MAG: hypothetical protein A9Z00_10210 [Thermobacillus sp. ZCTH02-B1]